MCDDKGAVCWQCGTSATSEHAPPFTAKLDVDGTIEVRDHNYIGHNYIGITV